MGWDVVKECQLLPEKVEDLSTQNHGEFEPRSGRVQGTETEQEQEERKRRGAVQEEEESSNRRRMRAAAIWGCSDSLYSGAG